jgi:hypothetical protein
MAAPTAKGDDALRGIVRRSDGTPRNNAVRLTGLPAYASGVISGACTQTTAA